MDPRKPDTHSFKILVVDDNRDVADTFAMFAEMWGYTVRTAYGGAQALKLTDEYSPDCVFLDISMPRMDGYAVARRIREQSGMQSVTLIALSGFSDAVHLRKLREAGFDNCLMKPADPNEIKRILVALEHEKRRLAHDMEILNHKKEGKEESTS